MQFRQMVVGIDNHAIDNQSDEVFLNGVGQSTLKDDSTSELIVWIDAIY